MTTRENDLITQIWDKVYKETDVDAAYEAFLNMFEALYDKNCPIIKQSWK